MTTLKRGRSAGMSQAPNRRRQQDLQSGFGDLHDREPMSSERIITGSKRPRSQRTGEWTTMPMGMTERMTKRIRLENFYDTQSREEAEGALPTEGNEITPQANVKRKARKRRKRRRNNQNANVLFPITSFYSDDLSRSVNNEEDDLPVTFSQGRAPEDDASKAVFRKAARAFEELEGMTRLNVK